MNLGLDRTQKIKTLSKGMREKTQLILTMSREAKLYLLDEPIGGAVILGAYETGTGIYRLMNMPGLPLPSNRIELAELVWERAGKPEPQNMTDEDLYADIDAADTDAQKAAHWMVEQELMKFDEDNNKFHPCFPVSKLRVCLTWQNAKDKGLID